MRNLKPIAIMLQLVRPARPGGRLFGDDWLTRMNESGRARLMADRVSYATTCRRRTPVTQIIAMVGNNPTRRTKMPALVSNPPDLCQTKYQVPVVGGEGCYSWGRTAASRGLPATGTFRDMSFRQSRNGRKRREGLQSRGRVTALRHEACRLFGGDGDGEPAAAI